MEGGLCKLGNSRLKGGDFMESDYSKAVNKLRQIDEEVKKLRSQEEEAKMTIADELSKSPYTLIHFLDWSKVKNQRSI